MWPANAVKDKNHDLRILQLQMARLRPVRLYFLHHMAMLIRFMRIVRIPSILHPLDPEGGTCRLHEGIRADKQGEAKGVKEENKIERKYGVRFAEPRAEAGFFQGTQEQGYGQ